MKQLIYLSILFAVAPIVNKQKFGSIATIGEFVGSMVVAVDNNYSFDTYVRSPSIQKIFIIHPLIDM
jgi:hypothetical protein